MPGDRWVWFAQDPRSEEQWSEPWGGSEAQWFSTIYTRLRHLLPAASILEISSGYGRWTRQLLPHCSQYLGVDASENAVKFCEKAFARFDSARFAHTAELSLETAADGQFDLVFSFDSLVHAEIDVMAKLIGESLKKLKPTGAVFLHHSNVGEFASIVSDPAPGGRARSVSSQEVRSLIESHGGRTIAQEMINWGGGELLADGITVFSGRESAWSDGCVYASNSYFSTETSLAKGIANTYSHISGPVSPMVKTKRPATPPSKREVDISYDSGGNEVKKSYLYRLESGFFDQYLSGDLVLDIGFRGADNPLGKTIVPHAIGVDTDFPGYDGMHLPFADNSVDAVSSSHCIEHIWFVHAAIRDWYRVLKPGGFIVCFAPHQHLYEKRLRLPSRYNFDHKRMLTPSSLLGLFEESLNPNTYRIRHLCDNDRSFDYGLDPWQHSTGCYEIELVLEKIVKPTWNLVDD